MDVVVPFRGAPGHLEELRARLGRMQLRPGDSVVVVDNTPEGLPLENVGDGRPPVIHAGELTTPGFARNRGAAQGSAEWLVFFDADAAPPGDLLDRYFDPPPGERTAALSGGVLDEPIPKTGPLAARYAYIRELMSQDNTQRLGEFSFVQTANVAVRRAAFEEMAGFRQELRAAEDADLSYRLRAAGWETERREGATVTHRGRQTTRGFIAQKLLHGSGGAWLASHYPGAFPAHRKPGLLWWALRTCAKGLLSAARTRDRDAVVWAVFEPLEVVAYEFGRLLPNERPLPYGRRTKRFRSRRI